MQTPNTHLHNHTSVQSYPTNPTLAADSATHQLTRHMHERIYNIAHIIRQQFSLEEGCVK